MSSNELETSPLAAADGHVAAPSAAASASATTLTSAQHSSVQTQDQDDPPPADDSSPPPPPPFESLFTLLINTTTHDTIHPRVQYIFSDDDTSVLSAPPGPAAAAGPHRPVLVDLAPSPDGSSWTVAWASSLSPDFALTASRLEPAPQQQHEPAEPDANSSAAPGGVLRLEGVEREPVDARPESLPGSASGSGTVGREDVDALADDFRRRMGVLRRVVGEAERRNDVVRRQQQPQPQQSHSAESRPAEPDGSIQDGEARAR